MPGVQFTEKSAGRIADVVREVEDTPRAEPVQQRRRAGGYRMLSLWEVTEVQEDDSTVTVKRVQDTDENLNDQSESLGVAYLEDDPPTEGQRGTVLRLGDGTRIFFTGGVGAGGGIVPIKITGFVNNDTYIGDVFADGTDKTATETGVTIRILQVEAGGSLPTGTKLPAWRQPWADVFQYTVDLSRDY